MIGQAGGRRRTVGDSYLTANYTTEHARTAQRRAGTGCFALPGLGRRGSGAHGSSPRLQPRAFPLIGQAGGRRRTVGDSYLTANYTTEHARTAQRRAGTGCFALPGLGRRGSGAHGSSPRLQPAGPLYSPARANPRFSPRPRWMRRKARRSWLAVTVCVPLPAYSHVGKRAR